MEEQHQKGVRREIALQFSVVRLEQENKELRANSDVLNAEKQELSKTCQKLEAELDRTRKQVKNLMLETSKTQTEIVALASSLTNFKIGDIDSPPHEIGNSLLTLVPIEKQSQTSSFNLSSPAFDWPPLETTKGSSELKLDQEGERLTDLIKNTEMSMQNQTPEALRLYMQNIQAQLEECRAEYRQGAAAVAQ